MAVNNKREETGDLCYVLGITGTMLMQRVIWSCAAHELVTLCVCLRYCYSLGYLSDCWRLA
jgi:hypothetical protein